MPDPQLYDVWLELLEDGRYRLWMFMEDGKWWYGRHPYPSIAAYEEKYLTPEYGCDRLPANVPYYRLRRKP